MRFKEWNKPIIKEGELTKWNWMVQGVKGLKLGKNTDIGAFTYINAQAGVIIGDNVEIGSHCSIYSKNTIENKQGRVIIGKNSKIGTHSTIMQGVTIGDNCLIGAYSFVNKDILSNTKAYGIPAKAVKLLVNDCKLINEFVKCSWCGAQGTDNIWGCVNYYGIKGDEKHFHICACCNNKVFEELDVIKRSGDWEE